MHRAQPRSRFGCKGCKTRRIKCDERRPSCSKCVQAGKPCSYPAGAPRVTATTPPQPFRHNATVSASAPSLTSGSFLRSPCLASPRPRSASLESGLHVRYGSVHLGLLYHFEHHVGFNSDVAGLMIEEATKTPYLMDGILAYAAAHRSTLVDSTQLMYVAECNRLQTDAIASYNRQRPTVSQHTCRAMFAFSCLMDHQSLFHICSTPSLDLTAALEGLIQSIDVHHGLSTFTRDAWSMFDEQLRQRFHRNCIRDDNDSCVMAHGECDELLDRLNASDLGPSSLAVHREAVQLLQNVFNNLLSDPESTLTQAVFDWLTGVSAEYIHDLQRRRAEALVTLAYFAVLLHRAAKCWFIGDLGKRVVHLINEHLGPFWADWLVWPNQMIENT